MSAQRARSAVEPSHRSIYPNIAGVPWWAALLIAIAATTIGYAIDAGSGHKELTHVFAGFYIAGCLAAVLAVRQDGVFTAIIQPPLILFCAVPGAYWLFHGGNVGKVKDLLINCGYPLIERFPLMLGTAGGVLLIGLGRWYFGMSHRNAQTPAPDEAATTTGTGAKSFLSSMAERLRSILVADAAEDGADEAATAGARRSRSTGASSRSRRDARSGRSGTRSARTHSRHARRPLDDKATPERPRRSTRRGREAEYDYDAAESPRPRRRPRPEAEPDPRGEPPRGSRREPRTRRSPYERPTERATPRGSRFDGLSDPPRAPEHFGRYERYEPPYEPRRRSATTNGAIPTHHPISQVRYRGAGPDDDDRPEPRGERRSRPRTGRHPRAEWEYDG